MNIYNQSQLDLVAIKRCEFTPKLTEMDLMATMEELKVHFDPKINCGNELKIVLEMDEEFPVPEKILFDPSRFKQTIYLILTNAFKYTKEQKGDIHIHTSFYKGKGVDNNEKLVIKISDMKALMALRCNSFPKRQTITDLQKSYGQQQRKSTFYLSIDAAMQLTKELGGSIQIYSITSNADETQGTIVEVSFSCSKVDDPLEQLFEQNL